MDRGDLAYPDLVRLPSCTNKSARIEAISRTRTSCACPCSTTRCSMQPPRRAGRHVMKPHELAKRYPGLVGTGSRRDGVRRMYAAVTRNLNRCTHVLAAGRQEHVQAGQFRHDAAGRLLRAEATASHGETTVPASICESELRPTMCLQCEPDEAGDDEECDDCRKGGRRCNNRPRQHTTPSGKLKRRRSDMPHLAPEESHPPQTAGCSQ